MSLKARPIYLTEASAFVELHHRHSVPLKYARFSLAAVEGDTLVGVAICGRPVARALDDGKTMEVLRVCTTGERNAPSFLYSRAVRIAEEMGYTSVITYTLQSESGVSLMAVGAVIVASVKYRETKSWRNRPGRKDQTKSNEDKFRWELLSLRRLSPDVKKYMNVALFSNPNG